MIGERLKKLREKHGLLQRQLADMLKLTQQTISLYESNQREPDAETLRKIADFFNTTTDYLLARTDDPTPPEEHSTADKNTSTPWWEKDEPPTDIELEEFIKNQSNIKLMGNPLDEKTKDDVIMFLRAAHEFIKQKRKAEESAGEKDKK
ncbi:XRE family transcriptional regulator [Biomaibacter acetigenes]|uniref:XRE family transcriptional regulator n=1 Tax=Biomaibacter acetigenes TaxID=2316383 RepID=A0A3G2R5C0_9FIRM|nr:helix-turn-helix transcriptional regulator [Biomaibacter acetigenes]AYO30640.1 XRE family transcriptional regulator [Biomaibacter acetigenes]